MNDFCFTFDMSKPEIHYLLGKEPDYIMPSLEYYDDFRIDYDKDGGAVAFEFFSWANIMVESDDFPDLKGKNLFSVPNKKLNRLIKKCDSSAQTDSLGVISLKYGIGTYCESSNKSDTIIIFKKGYYDSLGWE